MTERQAEDALLDVVQALLRSNDDLAGFAARVAHDLRSPLGAVIGQLQLADGLLGEEVPPATSRAVASALGAAERMRRTVDDLLAYATLTVAPAVEDVDLGAVTTAVAADVAAPALTGPGTVVVPTDPTLVRLLLQNLVQNALRHAGDDAHVVVDAGAEDGRWWLAVHDDGPGVPPEIRERVFEPLVRGARTGGTGTGLATCARIAEALGGTIGVGDSPYGGAVFRVAVRT